VIDKTRRAARLKLRHATRSRDVLSEFLLLLGNQTVPSSEAERQLTAKHSAKRDAQDASGLMLHIRSLAN
jgi:hypothetical protein